MRCCLCAPFPQEEKKAKTETNRKTFENWWLLFRIRLYFRMYSNSHAAITCCRLLHAARQVAGNCVGKYFNLRPNGKLDWLELRTLNLINVFPLYCFGAQWQCQSGREREGKKRKTANQIGGYFRTCSQMPELCFRHVFSSINLFAFCQWICVHLRRPKSMLMIGKNRYIFGCVQRERGKWRAKEREKRENEEDRNREKTAK